ncbi:hypothetical protein PR202_gb15172 [Eleusine coracana subsp. coracana]|uniref:Uncharacterized protein n=1 Tax=Eleusine coracana subsp. coracana TaxID=191504 RepID=A0AAV5EY77_ELECO|nr:hypothetical protein PR202_gb15172 [Eleusine coracana subsp. coracana]
MMSTKMRGILTVLLLVVAISSAAFTAVEAARRLPEEGDTDHATLHERARSLVMTWMAQLRAGPSPRGPGH